MELESDENDDDYYYVVPPWVCSRCTLINQHKDYWCSACEKPHADAWLCRHCSNVQHVQLRECSACRTLRCRQCDYQNDPHTKQCAICDGDL